MLLRRFDDQLGAETEEESRQQRPGDEHLGVHPPQDREQLDHDASPRAVDEIDFVAVYCDSIDRCYLLPSPLVAGRREIYLRLSPARNGQRACINLGSEYELPGAVAQLEERVHGMHEAGGSSPPSSTSPATAPAVVETGAHQFRNHFGYYMERAAAGEEIHVSRRGKPYVRLLPAEGRLQLAA